MIATSTPQLAFDSALPRRDLLLDAAAMAPRLARRLGIRGPRTRVHCERVKAKYRIGESLRALYRIELHGSPQLVAARMFPEGRGREVYERALATTIPCDRTLPVGFDPDGDIVFWAFPNDRKLVHAAALTDRALALDAVLEGHCAETRVIAYAPERAATAQCLGASGEVLAYAKVYLGAEGSRTQELHQALSRTLRCDDPWLRVPQVLAYDADHSLLLLEPLLGRPFAAIASAELETGFRRLGAALARFHQLTPPEIPVFTRLGPDRMASAARLIGRARPDVARLADTLASELTASWKPPAGPLVPLHGDVNSRNWLAQSERVALIDLDQMGWGSAAADLGGALAGLAYRRVSGGSEEVESMLTRALLKGYAEVGALPPGHEVRWHTAAALLVERALRAVTRLRADGLEHLDGLLAHGRDLLRERAHA